MTRAPVFLLPFLLPFPLGACYSTGDGTPPPSDSFYFPVGLAVSQGGNVLYAVNSDFDLQWNGGTIQSYDLFAIRRDTVTAIANPNDSSLPLLRPPTPDGACPSMPPIEATDNSGRQPLGQTCAPPVKSSYYVRDSAIIGAFATDLLLSNSGTRLYTPVRGDASVTWVDLTLDNATTAPAEPSSAATYAPFTLNCGTRVEGRCDDRHHAGDNALEPGNNRNITLPGEPFGVAQSQDGASLVVTHQTDILVSLFSTGFAPGADAGASAGSDPALQYVLSGVDNAGMGVVSIPHDPLLYDAGVALPQTFLETNRSAAEIDLLRYYGDEYNSGSNVASSLLRPYLMKEATFTLDVNSGGTDSRGLVIDPTPRLACEQRTPPGNTAAQLACAQIPSRVFISNRTPPSLILGEIGAQTPGSGAYNPDNLALYGNIPLEAGPSRVYLAPIIDATGAYSLRVFIVCFDTSLLFIYDPAAGQVENVVYVGQGPYAMAFDPFPMSDVAINKSVSLDQRPDAGPGLKVYRFAYVASFTNSFVQVIDLDNSRTDKSTFETVVYTLGMPTQPVGN